MAKASTSSVGELDGVIEQLRNNTRRCRADVDALLRVNEETGALADDAGKAIHTANGTLKQAEQQMQQLSTLMSKGSAEVDAARLLPKLVDLVHDSMLQTASAAEAMDHRRMSMEMNALQKRVEDAGVCHDLCFDL